MNKVRCLECKSLALKAYPRMANEGCGQCKQDLKSGQFVSYLFQRECDKYERAAEEVIMKRLAWQDQLKMYRRVEK